MSDGKLVKSVHRRRNRRRTEKDLLPALGIFWDIENCHVPKNKSAASLVHRIREIFMKNYREAEFVVVCDVKKENPQVSLLFLIKSCLQIETNVVNYRLDGFYYC